MGKKIFNLMLGVFIGLIFRFIVYTGFNDSNSVVNVLSFLITILIILFLYVYLKYSNNTINVYDEDGYKEPETELDYNPYMLNKKNKY